MRIDSTCHGHCSTMYEDVVDFVLRITLLLVAGLVVRECIKFWAIRTTASAATVSDSHGSRSSGVTVLTRADGESALGLTADRAAAGRWSRNGETKLVFGGCSISVEGAQRQPFAEVFFRLNLIMIGRLTRVQLTVEQLDFGVGNCCIRNCYVNNQQCDKNCKTVFIYKIEIQVSPKLWAQECQRLLMQPYQIAQVFGLQQNSMLNIQVPVARPQNASVSYQTGSTVSHTAPEYRWIPARRDDGSNSVSWALELYRYANGRKLEFGKLRWGFRPILGIRPSYMHIHPGSFLAEASWELQTTAELLQHRLAWDVKVRLHTAVLHGKGRLPGYLLTRGPTITSEKLLAFT